MGLKFQLLISARLIIIHLKAKNMTSTNPPNSNMPFKKNRWISEEF